MGDAASQLAELYGGFRQRFLTHQEIGEQLSTWQAAFPHLIRVEILGHSVEGRELWLATLGPQPDRVRPSVWVDGNMHAMELSGSSVALHIAETVLAMHLGDEAPLAGLGPNANVLRDVLFHVLPRMSPDGAERVLKTGRWVRSAPRDNRVDTHEARWLLEDVDEDGSILAMRKQDPTGEFVESKRTRGLMLPRQVGDEGPFYKVYPEGRVDPFDGDTIPTPDFTSDNDVDLNRNFPFHWAPEPTQKGAGRYPLSEPESRAVVEFTHARPQLFAWLNLHTFGGVFIRPPGDRVDKKLDLHERALFRQLGEWAEADTGYPMVSGFEEFTYTPDKPLHGDLIDYAYRQRGCVAYVCELFDLFKQIGCERPKRFVDHYTDITRDNLESFGAWDAEHNGGRAVGHWRAFEHPQLGEVEVGGPDPRVGVWNPPLSQLEGICESQARSWLRVASLAPHLSISRTELQGLGDGLYQLTIAVQNLGYLPTFVLPSARALPWNDSVHIHVETQGCELVDPADRQHDVGHLDGWGRGKFDGTGMLHMAGGRGSTASATVRCTIRGAGSVKIAAGNSRTGIVTAEMNVG